MWYYDDSLDETLSFEELKKICEKSPNKIKNWENIEKWEKEYEYNE